MVLSGVVDRITATAPIPALLFIPLISLRRLAFCPAFVAPVTPQRTTQKGTMARSVAMAENQPLPAQPQLLHEAFPRTQHFIIVSEDKGYMATDMISKAPKQFRTVHQPRRSNIATKSRGLAVWFAVLPPMCPC